MNVDKVGDFLKAHGIKPSYQRVKIFEYLKNTNQHPTVDTIYTALNDEIPTLSKTTVYNTLKTFIEKGIARVITIDENEARFDIDIEIHGHFKCEVCHQIFDFSSEYDQADNEDLKGFQIKEKQILFYGICRDCGIKKEED